MIGLDLGATKLAVKILTRQGEAIESTLLLPRYDNVDRELREITQFISPLLKQLDGEPITRSVCSAAASINAQGVVTRWPNRPYWAQAQLMDPLSALLKTDCLFVDDGHAAAWAEANAIQATHLIYIGIGTGIAGGLVLDGKLYRGMHGQSAEFGHLCVEPGGLQCVCGRAGCLQAYASGSALFKHAYPDHVNKKSKSEFFADLAHGNESVIRSLNLAAQMLASGLVQLSEIFDICDVVVGGGMGSDLFYLHEKTVQLTKNLRRPGQSSVIIHPAQYAERSSLEGALMLALKEMEL